MKRKLAEYGLDQRAKNVDVSARPGPSSDALAVSKKAPPSVKDAEILALRKISGEKKANIVPQVNKQRVLTLCSRGVTARYRHLLEDLRILLPHHKKEVKHDGKKKLYELNEIAEMKSCNNVMYFEVRKRKDLYMWLTKAPNGPSIKFHVVNVHTMDELRLTGNCLRGSRPLLTFDSEFDEKPHLALCKQVLSQSFGTPRGHPRSKPFVDHIMSFSLLDGRIWFRHFQITDTSMDPKEVKKLVKEGKETVNLVEIGPRFVLRVIKIFDGGFGGPTLYENPEYVSPNAVRAEALRSQGDRYQGRKNAEEKKLKRDDETPMPEDPLAEVFK